MTPTHRTRRDLTLVSGRRVPAGTAVTYCRMRAGADNDVFAVVETGDSLTPLLRFFVDPAELEPIETTKEETEP